MKDKLVEQQIVKMNKKSRMLLGKSTRLARLSSHLSLRGIDNDEKSPMIVQLASLQRLKEVGWYWGPLSWIDAERLLRDKQDYSFIVRDSSHRHYFLAITFKSQGNIHHTRIEHSNSELTILSSRDEPRVCVFAIYMFRFVQLLSWNV